MALKTINDEYLIAIGEAIRKKNGTEETYKPSEMAEAIRSIEGGGIGEIILTGDCIYALAAPAWDSILSNIETENITNCKYMFYTSPVETAPIEINCKIDEYIDCSYMFYKNVNLKEIPKFNNCKPNKTYQMFANCYNLREIPEEKVSGIDMTAHTTNVAEGADRSSMFLNCYSLRSIPSSLLAKQDMAYNSYNNSYYYQGFRKCYNLEELVDIPVVGSTIYSVDSNMFYYTFSNCSRLKELTFATDGAKYIKWCNQTIDLSDYVGYFNGYTKAYDVLGGYNTGIDTTKRGFDSTTFNAYKDDPDFFTDVVSYSRYNHDSAVRTINSLPDTSIYVSEKGKPNIIKFRGQSGSGYSIDGRNLAISNLTDAEIAVATAKGWTVSFV